MTIDNVMVIAYIEEKWYSILEEEDHMPFMQFEGSLQGRATRPQFCYEMLGGLCPSMLHDHLDFSSPLTSPRIHIGQALLDPYQLARPQEFVEGTS